MLPNVVNSCPRRLAEAIFLTKRFAEGTPAGRGSAAEGLAEGRIISNELEGNKKHHSIDFILV